MIKIKSNDKLDNLNNISPMLKVFSRNYNIGDYYKYNLAKSTGFGRKNSKKNILKNHNKYDKLYFHEKEKYFSYKTPNQKNTKRIINLKKINNFHQILMQTKIKSLKESIDYSDLTLNNKTTSITEFYPTNFSNIATNKYSNTKTINLQNYNDEIENMKNNIDIINNKKIILNINKILNKDINFNEIGNSKSISLNKDIIKNKNVINSFKVKKPIKIINYKFKDIYGNPNDNIYSNDEIYSSRYTNNPISEQIKTKLRYNIINEVQKEYLENQMEKLTNPRSLINNYELLHKKNKNNFEVFEILVKKYFGNLYSNIEKEKKKLFLLKEKKENLKEDNFQITKKINYKKDQIKLFQNLIILLIKIRYNVDSLNKVSKDCLEKYGVMRKGKKNFGRKNSMMITDLKDNSYMKNFRKKYIEINNKNNSKTNKMKKKKSSVFDIDGFKNSKTLLLYSPKRLRDEHIIIPTIPVFNSANELDSKIKLIEYNIKELVQQLSYKRYKINRLKLELSKNISEYISNNKKKKSFTFNETENDELNALKQKYYDNLNLKNSLISKVYNYIEYKPKTNKSDNCKNTNNKLDFSEKLISFLLKIDINIEDLLDQNGIYKFLNSPEESKIIYKSKEYNKTFFCVKILEIIFLYLMEQRMKYLYDDKKREKYLEYQEMIDKKNRIKNLKEFKNVNNKRIDIRNKKIISRFYKINILPIKKDDPFSYVFSRNKTIEIAKKNRAKTENEQKEKLLIENEIMY